jgi:glycosyltransferase involved in cell wall biosynthesis
MRVCMLVYAFYEMDTRVMQYATALASRGDVVDVIALRREGLPEYEFLDGVNVYRIQPRIMNERGRLNYLWRILRFCLHSALVLTRKHLKNRYQLIHVHSVPDFLAFAALVPKLFGTPIILDIHDVLPELYASKFGVGQTSVLFKLLVLVEKASTAFSNHVIVANDLWRERLVSRSVRAEKCTTVRNYPDPQIFYPRRKRAADGKFLIIYPGTLNWHQGLDVAIKAFARLKHQIPEAEFHIYGEGPARASLIELVKQLGLEDKIVFHGFLPTDQIAPIMANADLAVEPKRSQSAFGTEALSMKILEFMALDVPLVVSRTKIHSRYYDDSMAAMTTQNWLSTLSR